MKFVFEWADSKVIGVNLSKEQLVDEKKYKWKFWVKTVVKLYYELSKSGIEKYHKFHNEVKAKYDDTIFEFSKPVFYEGKEYSFAKIRFLLLEDNFITPWKLKNKLDKKLFFDLIKEIKSSRYKVCSIQNYVKWINVSDYISSIHKSLTNFPTNESELELNIKKLQQIDSFQDGFIQIIEEFNKKVLPFIKNPNYWFAFDNFQIVVWIGDVLEIVITDIWGNIKNLLPNL